MQQTPKFITMKWTTFFIVIVIVVIAVGLAGYVGYSTGNRLGSKKAEQTTKAAYENVVKQFMPTLPETQTSFSGSVEKIEGKTLYLKGSKPTSDILEMGQETTLKVLVTDATKIYKLTMVTPTMPTEGGAIPEPFKKEDKKFEEIKQGMFITATAKDNIIDKDSFEAVEIQMSETGI
jgi:hypothetical protein